MSWVNEEGARKFHETEGIEQGLQERTEKNSPGSSWTWAHKSGKPWFLKLRKLGRNRPTLFPSHLGPNGPRGGMAMRMPRYPAHLNIFERLSTGPLQGLFRGN